MGEKSKEDAALRRIGCFLLAFCLWCTAVVLPAFSEGWIVDETEPDTPPDRRTQAKVLMERMSREDKVWQLLMVAPEALTGQDYTTALGKTNVLKERPVGGVVIFGQNIVSEKQLKKLTAALQTQSTDAGGYPLLIAVSEEGGNVARVANKLGYDLEMSAPEAGLRKDKSNALAVGKHIGAYLKPLGINVDFAPVCDVLTSPDGWIRERAYGIDDAVVTAMSQQMAKGLRSAGIIPCFSHFPGQGSINGNMNNRVVVNTRTVEEMRKTEWNPFRTAIKNGAEMIMVSHAPVKQNGDGLPASLSPVVIGQWLRKELKYDGVVITDSLRMGAITSEYKSGPAAVMALQAGADIVLLPADADAAAEAILEAVDDGEISMERIEESVQRILMLKIESGVIH